MQSGDVVGERFEIKQLAGEGGMGEVYRALDRSTGEPAAVKVLRKDVTSYRARFEREARVLSELSHPSIVRHLAHGFTGSGEPYLAMEWLDGEDLGSRLASGGGLTAEESLEIALCVANALGAAHARGVVHRDLKPTNIFMVGGRVGDTKLLDFGIAQLASATRLTQTGTVAGTPGYMAPEQVQHGGHVDARADVFSLGCVLFECLTRTPAFPGEHMMAILAKLLFTEPQRVRELRPELSGSIDELVGRMLSKVPDERPRDGGAVAEALASLGRLTEVTSTEAPGGRRTALTSTERGAISVVLVRGNPSEDLAMLETVDESRAEETRALRLGAEAWGGRCERLRDGSFLVSIGGPAVATDQAAHAARCALWLNEQAAGRMVALATGRGEIGGTMATGEAIDRAVRLLLSRDDESDGSQPAPVAIDEVTARLLDGRFDVRESSGGLSLHAEREIAEGTRLLLGKPTPCVGRDFELSVLSQMLDHCIEDSQARAALVIAPAGMGKSRLAHELMARLRDSDRPPVVWIGRGDPMRAGSALGLLSQVLRGACDIRDGEPLEARQQKLSARVARHINELERGRVAGFLGELIGTQFPDDTSELLRAARKDAQLMRDGMRRAWLDLLRAECAAQPLLLVLEDLHWCDESTVRFLDEALRELSSMPLMVLALARPEVRELFPKLWADRDLHELTLKQLSRRAGERLVRQVLSDQVGPETVEKLLAQADGNAFYLEELIRAVAERKSGELPETVVAMVQSRLGALDAEDRRALRAATIFGEVFWSGGVGVLLGLADKPAEVRERLFGLVELEVLVWRGESRFLGEVELAFRHMLLREGAHAMLTAEDRLLGHRLAGEWLVEHGEGDPVVLAEHFELGGELERAGDFYLKAADRAHRMGDGNAAQARAERGLECGVSGDLRAALLGLLCEVAAFRNDPAGTVLPYVEEIMTISPRGSLPWVQAALAKVSDLMLSGRMEEVATTLEDLIKVTPEPPAIITLLLALSVGLYALDLAGHIARSDAIFLGLVEMVASIAEPGSFASAYVVATKGCRYHLRGDPWASMMASEEGYLAFKAAQDRSTEIMRVIWASALWFLGACEQAERELRAKVLPDEQLALLSSLRPFSLSGLLADRGALDEALAEAVSLVEMGRSLPNVLSEGRGRWALSEVHRRRGELDDAEREALASLELFAALPLDHIGATATLAAVHLAKGRVALALATAEDALSRYVSQGVCGMFRGAFLRLVHAECLRAAGDHEAARAAIATARECILANCAKIGDADYQRGFLKNVPENARTLELAREWLGEDGQAGAVG